MLKIIFYVFLFVFLPSEVFAEKKHKSYCQQAKDFKPKVNIHLDKHRIQYDYSLSIKDLTHNRKDAIKKWQDKQEDAVWTSSNSLEVEGLTRGGVGVETSARLLAKPYDMYGVYYCPYIQELDIHFYYKTTIFIASDYKKETCKFNAVLEHEMKHHNANVRAVDAAVSQFKKDLPAMISYLERRYIKREDVNNNFKKMNLAVSDAFKIYSEIIVENMEKLNNPIDTVEEYERVAALCH